MYVLLREHEHFEELYRRFKRGLEQSGILREYRRRQRFIPKHERRLEKRRKAERRKRRAEASGRNER